MHILASKISLNITSDSVTHHTFELSYFKVYWTRGFIKTTSLILSIFDHELRLKCQLGDQNVFLYNLHTIGSHYIQNVKHLYHNIEEEFV